MLLLITYFACGYLFGTILDVELSAQHLGWIEKQGVWSIAIVVSCNYHLLL